MSKKITINYFISDDMKVAFSSDENLKDYQPYLDRLKTMTKKYLLEVDNILNLKEKIIKAGKLEFVLGDLKIIS